MHLEKRDLVCNALGRDIFLLSWEKSETDRIIFEETKTLTQSVVDS